ncbi:glycosyltransferase family 4 protein [Kaistella sp. PBT33-4]|uniref:glycosyltransferase family 4 protein n=1 Tax=Kaistella sp. PBT33-4 TaxID=3032000 RepID=UPI0023D7E41E|nr:glycosyltransferase family 4 protein [Kaistella sp. PBT33-4]MDF0718789.1 glycosyltransferase family 4 protein [Kaistella sp. PBT33-4]
MPKLIRITTVPLSLDKLLGRQLTFMNNCLDVTAISADEKELARVAQKYGVKYFHLEMTREITPLQDLKALWKLYGYLRREKPQIVHTHTPKAGIVGMLAAKLAGVPNRLHTVAGMPLMEASGAKRMVLDLVEKMTYASATKVYPNSKGLYDFIVMHQYAPTGKLKVIGNGSSNGIDTAFFSPDVFTERKCDMLRNELLLKPQVFVFVFVGRLVGDKGINELVAAFKKLVSDSEKSDSEPEHNEDLPSVKLLLVGPLETELDPLQAETLEEIENNSHIIMTGYQNDVRPYFAVSNALVFPSYREGFPNVVMQAGAMGLPAIVTDINGCNEIVEEGVNGTIIPTKDTEALYEAMKTMLQDEEWRMRLKKNARPMITARYEQQVVWEALLEEYRAMVPILKERRQKI